MFLCTPSLVVTATLSLAAQCAAESGTSGSSILGTLQQKPLPRFLENNPLLNCFPWGNKNSKRDDPKNPPQTGITRYYDFTISRGTSSADGFLKQAMLINNQYPGPLVEANWGDWIQVTVSNNITGPEDGTSIHWHGLLQKETPWMDVVPSISQCPIAPGSTFTYHFRADVHGTGWYHSHYSAQYLDGLFGPMIIYGPTHTQFDEDLGVIMVQDYFHRPYFSVLEDGPFNRSLAAPGSTCSSAGATYSKFRVQTGKIYKLRLINPGAGSIEYFSIDNHQLTLISNDFVDIVPYNTTIITLGTGQRLDVLFTPKGNGSMWMRTETSGKFCGGARSVAPRARAIILLDNSPEDTIPTTTSYPPPVDNGMCANDPLNLTVPYFPMALPEPSVTYDILINQAFNATGQKLFYMNGNSFQGDYNDPILLLAEQKNFSYPYDPKWNVVNFQTNTSIRINVYNNNTSPHPMHLHRHDFYVLHEGAGRWDGVSVNHPENPQHRDTQNLSPFGHVVIQFNADNPGTWPFHCHIGWHLSQGLFMTFMERPRDTTKRQIPLMMTQTCKNWDAFTKKNIVDQIDSGLKKRGQTVRHI